MTDALALVRLRIAELRAQQHEDDKSTDYYLEGTTGIGNLEAALDIAEELLALLEGKPDAS